MCHVKLCQINIAIFTYATTYFQEAFRVVMLICNAFVFDFDSTKGKYMVNSLINVNSVVI